MSGPNVITLDAKNLTNIPERLHDLAVAISLGKIPADCALVVIRRPDGLVQIHGYGSVESHDSQLGLLERAKVELALMCKPVR